MTSTTDSGRVASAGLGALLRPGSIAVIGASNDPSRIGGIPVELLRRSGFPGAIYPVNPGREVVQGLTCYPSVAAVGAAVDLAVVALPANQVVSVVAECAAAGVRAVVVFSAGFAESGPEGQALQTKLSQLVDETGIRVLGPNCAGVMNLHARSVAAFGSHLATDTALEPGPIAILSQSGAVGGYVYALARRAKVGVSHWVTTGNEVDITVADVLASVAEDPLIEVVAMYLEQIRDGDRFIAAAAAARRAGKRLFAIRAGRSAASAEALRSHTAALAGDGAIADRALLEAGVVLVDRLEDLVEASVAARSSVLPRGPRLGLVTISGAAGILMVDACADEGLSVPRLDEAAQARLRAVLPYAATANPLDVTGMLAGQPHLLGPFLSELTDHPDIDHVICYLGTALASPATGHALAGELMALSSRKPIWVVALVGEEMTDLLATAGIPVFADPTRAVKVMAAAHRARTAPVPGPRRTDIPARSIAPFRAPLTESAASELLGRHGVAFPRSQIVSSGRGAESVAAALGGRVVMKISSKDILHKTDVGGVRVGVDAEHAAAAFEDLIAAVRANRPDADLEGVLVQEVVEGHPVIVGTKLDPTFGPVIVVGSGGILAEVVKDTAIALAPVDAPGARDLLARTNLPAVLSGARGGPKLDTESLIAIVVRVSELAWTHRDTIAGIDVNPVLVGPARAVAVDALVEPVTDTKRTF